jgi:hypothetical protein
MNYGKTINGKLNKNQISKYHIFKIKFLFEIKNTLAKGI